MKISISAKFILSTLLVSLLIVSSFTYNQYRSEYNLLEEKFGLALKHIAITAALRIKGEDHAKIKKPSDVKKKPFKKIKKYLNQVREKNYLHSDHIYTFHLKSNKKLIFCVMLHKKPFVGDKYEVPEQNQPLVARAIAGEPVQTGIYRDAHGIWISAFAPIKTRQGKVAGILAVDYDVEKFYMALGEKVSALLLEALAILIFGVVIVLLVAYSISKPIKKLSSAVKEISQGNYGTHLEINSHDEVGDLARAFNEMSDSLNEKFHMLRYISPHTREMIEKLSKNELSEKGELKNVAILFSDIRGFTSFSEHRAPEDVVETLNKLLTLQSELIVRYEGKIDKYVGDEVVAIFEGPDRASNALYAGLEIQSAIAEYNKQNEGESLAVGIGIAIGDVIMGNIGSKERTDYTIIGSNVNLAARLCSRARQGEVLISSDAHRMAERDERISHVLDFNAYGEISLKGFSVPIHVFGVNYKGINMPARP